MCFCTEFVIREDKNPLEIETTENSKRAFNYDVVDVSNGFLTRVAYKKKVKTSKLDGLLERRVKQHSIEETQRRQLPASKPRSPTTVSSIVPAVMSTPGQPRPSLHTTPLTLGHPVKVEGNSPKANVLKSTDNNVTLTSFSLNSAPRDSCTTGTPCDSSSGQSLTSSVSREQQADVERTTEQKENNLHLLDHEVDQQLKITETSAQNRTVDVSFDATKAAHLQNTDSEVPSSKQESIRTFPSVLDHKSCEKNSPSKPEPCVPVHVCTEENGTGPKENQENAHNIEPHKTKAMITPETPQVNGNNDFEVKGTLSNSVVVTNNSNVSNSPKPNMNKTNNDGQGQVDLLKGSVQQKPVVNGDLPPVHNCADAAVNESVALKDTTPKSDQDDKPQDISKLKNNLGALRVETSQHNSQSPYQSSETSSVVKIIRMAPSPVPSAEESSLSDDFTENSNSGVTEQPKTITQVTTSTTTTTSVVSTQMKIPPPSNACRVATVTESSSVSTLTTMTKTTVTKISELNGQPEDNKKETVTQEQGRLHLSSVCKSTVNNVTTSVSSVTISQEDFSSTKGRIRLLKFSRNKKARSNTALPSYCKFVTKSKRTSIFVLQHDDLKVLARRGGFREVAVFSYNSKPAPDIWPYPSPRPSFGIAWR